MKNKKVILSILVVFAILIIIALGIVIFIAVDTTPELYEPIEKIQFFSEWQSYVKDEAKLNKVVIPGSHDAGTNNMMSLARTQGHDIIDQLNGGVRYFDLRVDWQRDKLVIFHGPIKGMTFEKVVNDIKTFLTNNPTEFIVLDFQHLGDTVNEATLRNITNTLNMSNAMKKSVLPTFEDATFGDLRANNFNFVIVWNNKTECDNNDYLYYRNENLFSFYDGNIHKKPDTNVLINHFDEYYNRYKNKGLFVLQSQKTALLLDKPSLMEKQSKALFNKFLIKLKTTPDKLEKTNIVMRDFIVSDLNTVRLILSLNASKNLIKPDKLNAFISNTTIN